MRNESQREEEEEEDEDKDEGEGEAAAQDRTAGPGGPSPASCLTLDRKVKSRLTSPLFCLLPYFLELSVAPLQ